MLQHYLQLLRHYRFLALTVIVVVTALAAVSSALLLALSPVYTATATVAVIPTQAEYSFGSEVSRGPSGTARVLTATYIEYLKSRPVVARALEKLRPQIGEDGSPSSAFARFVTDGSSFVRRMYRIVDSGRFVPIGQRAKPDP